MTRFTITSDDQRELERARSILSKSYVIQKVKAPHTDESQRFRLYLYAIPKSENADDFRREMIKNGDAKKRRGP